MPSDELRTRLRALCAAAALSHSALAERANKAPSVINKFLAGTTDSLAPATLEALERAALDAICDGGVDWYKSVLDEVTEIVRACERKPESHTGRRIRLLMTAANALMDIAAMDAGRSS
jgi:transcriptional regulator with XRE-family HTH domain